MSQEEEAPLNEKGHMDFVMLDGVDVQAYPQYAAMSASERRSLPSTNFWRQKNGQPLIPVPRGSVLLPLFPGGGSSRAMSIRR